MSVRAADVLELLLPGGDAALQARARRVTTFLRLLANDASPRRAASVRLGIEGARAELERTTRARVLSVLQDLVAHHLAAARSPDSFLEIGSPSGSHQDSWSGLEELRAEVAGLPHVPSPGERPLEVASRLIAAAERLGLAGPDAALLRARHTRLEHGAHAGEGAFLELLGASQRDTAPRLARAALAGAVECLLDRGAVRRAAALLAERVHDPARDERLRLLLGWSRLLLGDEEGAGAMLDPTSTARLPSSLVALRAARPRWLPLLAGRAARGATRREPETSSRADLGAALLAVFALDPTGVARPLHVDCAPALRPALRRWLEGRDGACRRAGELEREMVAQAGPAVAHLEGREAPRGAIDPALIRAAGVVPLRSGPGEIVGWLRLECEHHLLPSPSRLRALARAWLGRVRSRREVAALDDERPAAPALPEEIDPGDPRAALLRSAVQELGAGTARRRWWGVAVRGGTPCVVATGGAALSTWRERRGGAGSLRRALVSGTAVGFDQPDPGEAIAADAASGLAFPVVHRGEVLGLVVVESARRRDLAALAPLLAAQVSRLGAELRAAGFRAWHRGRLGYDVHFDLRVPRTAALAEELLAASTAAGPVALSGPAGSGKQVIARWLHYQSGNGDGPFVVHACGAREAAAEERELFGRGGTGGRIGHARGGTLVLDDLERLAPAAQARLERLLGSSAVPGQAARLVLTLRVPLRAARGEARLREDLARRLERLELHVPALAERREEIPALARHLAGRFAAELQRPAPELSDEALALLWRQPWEGNVRELENVVYKLVLLDRSGRVEREHVDEVARRFRLELARRVPPRAADRALVEAALRTTRTLRGTANKTRAALYLGWDPDTLARRLQDEAIEVAAALGRRASVSPAPCEDPAGAPSARGG